MLLKTIWNSHYKHTQTHTDTHRHTHTHTHTHTRTHTFTHYKHTHIICLSIN